jgi:hypothetical protein
VIADQQRDINAHLSAEDWREILDSDRPRASELSIFRCEPLARPLRASC